MQAKTIQLGIVSDVICPWCYIGKHRLEQALETLEGELAVAVHWRAYELNPDMPLDGMDRKTYCERKFGSLEYANQLYANVAANAAADGLPMAVDRIARTPSTRAAHRLIWLAGEAGLQDEMVDALFQAYFVAGLDIGDATVLAGIAESVGLESGRAARVIAGDEGDEIVERDIDATREIAIQGVPTFLINGRFLFSGAQSPETISLAIKRAVEKGV